eukprot:EG_transcript_1270
MRLSVIFLLVLALSAIVTSMAAWGITYGTSSSQVSTMASRFADLSQRSLQAFGVFVTDLLADNAGLVGAILDVQQASGMNRTEQTKVQMKRTIDGLINYTANASDQTQQQLEDVVRTFSGLMDSVVGTFKGLATGYAAQTRADMAAKGTATTLASITSGNTEKKRFQQLLDVGLLDVSRTPTDPIGEVDCTVLGLLCSSADATQSNLFLQLATGRLYSCEMLLGGAISTLAVNGSLYNESRLRWPPYAANVSAADRKSMKERCLFESPNVDIVGLNCPQPQGCQCGADQRCGAWYQQYANATTSYFVQRVDPEPSSEPLLHVTYSLVNQSSAPPTLLGVLESRSSFAKNQAFLANLVGSAVATYLAVLLNGTEIPVVGSTFRPCSANETVPGDHNLPVWSGLRACDPGLRAVAQWLAGNASLSQASSMEFSGLLWEIFPINADGLGFFFVVGSNKSVSNSAIDGSEAAAATQLAAVRNKSTSRMAASAAATRAYVAALGVQNVLETQAVQDETLAELRLQRNASQAAVAVMQDQSSASSQIRNAAQTTAVADLKTRQLSAMAVTAGWTIGLVLAIILAVLGLAAGGTIRVTASLTHIIGLMEAVARMQVEDLPAPKGASVEEVARIQAAFQVMVRRLAEYKSYIPAAVFEELQQAKSPGAGGAEKHLACLGTANESICGLNRSRPGQRQWQSSSTLAHLSSGHSVREAAPVSPVHMQAVRSGVAVLCINVTGLTDLLLSGVDGQAKELFNNYVVVVHTLVSRGRGNVDLLVGDQIVVTFNAHLPCADPAGAAAAAALEMRQQLADTLGDALHFQVGLAYGPVFATSVGYAKFKAMVTVGSPSKVAAILARREGFARGTVLADHNLQARLRDSCALRPVELLHLPWLKSFARDTPESHCIFALLDRRNPTDNEWLYQLGKDTDFSEWAHMFDRLLAATAEAEVVRLVRQYLAGHPEDDIALRLKDRLPLWVPGRGIRV